MSQEVSTEDSQGGSASRAQNEPKWEDLDPSGNYERAGTWLLIMEEQLAWYCHGLYMGHTLKRKDDGWLLILRAQIGGKNKVCFTTGDSPTATVRHLAYDMRSNRTRWQTDRYA